jgi:Lipase maturation factor
MREGWICLVGPDAFAENRRAMPRARAATTAPDRSTYWLTRFMLLRLLGVVYAVAFLAAVNQLVPLIGEQGLLPVGPFLDRVSGAFGSPAAGFARLPSFFWIQHSDAALLSVSWTGLLLSCGVAAGFGNALVLALLWMLYMSIVHVGQDWYGYGWELQLLETGFLAIFLCPLFDPRPFPRREPPVAVIWLFRWLAFRVMLGSGLIKIRGDPAWRDLTALDYHFETQPLPNPLSRWFHFLPRVVLRIGTGFNHGAELVAPWFALGPRATRQVAGGVIVLFQLTIILSGNLSFLNWLTIVPALACIDDSAWSRVLPGALVRRAQAARESAQPSQAMRRLSWGLAALVALLSVRPCANLLSAGQIMNTSFDPLELVNTYGAFGTVGRERLNVVFEGTKAETPESGSDWKPYPYVALPEDPGRRPPQIAPYQPRLDWQMWFAAMSSPSQYPWTVHLVSKLLHNDPGAVGLFANNPFRDRPPRFVRATLYRYRFSDPARTPGQWWERQRLGEWLPPLSADDPRLIRFLRAYGWLPDSD